MLLLERCPWCERDRMNRRNAWALIGAAFVVMLVLLYVIWKYAIGGLLWYTIALYVAAIVLLLNIRRMTKKRKQASSVIPSI
jgi:4-hydroxybenzoate polyprenyltransferase